MMKEQGAIDISKRDDVYLVDVRTAMEFRTVHALNAVNHPLDKLDVDKIKQEAGDREVCLICKSGARAAKAFKKCEGEITRLSILKGGTDQWVSEQCNVVRGKKGMSLERQVRIAAGLLILFGTLLSLFLHPGFIGLAIFVGAGLVFAGITDFCGMGLLLAKCPWNKV